MSWIINIFNPSKRIGAEKIYINSAKEKFTPAQEVESAYRDLVNRMREDQKRGTDIDKSFDELTGPNYRVYTVTDWLNAIRSSTQPWQKKFFPNWVQLFDIYSNMVNDTHVEACVDILTEGVLHKEFYIADEDGIKNDELTKLIEKKWFYDFLKAIVNIRLWGFGLIQIRSVDKSNLTIEIEEINRKHVRFDLGGVVKQVYDNAASKLWGKEPYKTWTIPVWDSVLGKFNPCVRWWIYKTEIARFWARFNQYYGIPPVIAKTSIKDKARKDTAITMLKNWISTRWLVIDEGDEVEGFNTSNSGSGQQYFENLIRLANEEISKRLLGGTMVLDNGSSRSQAEVHEKTVEGFIKSYARLAQFVTNDELLPRLRKIGFPIPDGAKFVWDESEKMTIEQKTSIIAKLAPFYNISEGVIADYIGIEVEQKELGNVTD